MNPRTILFGLFAVLTLMVFAPTTTLCPMADIAVHDDGSCGCPEGRCMAASAGACLSCLSVAARAPSIISLISGTLTPTAGIRDTTRAGMTWTPEWPPPRAA